MRFQDVIRFFTHPPISGPKSTIVIRLMAGGVFLSEGLLKFVYVNQGVGRFTKLGMPMPGCWHRPSRFWKLGAASCS